MIFTFTYLSNNLTEQKKKLVFFFLLFRAGGVTRIVSLSLPCEAVLGLGPRISLMYNKGENTVLNVL